MIWSSDPGPPIWYESIMGTVGAAYTVPFFTIFLFNRPARFVPPVYRSAPGFVEECVRALVRVVRGSR